MKLNQTLLSTYEIMLFRTLASGADDCIVAGGAIRDMLLDKPISDVDIFYEGSLNQNKLLEFFTWGDNSAESLQEDYESAGSLWSLTYGNMKCKYSGMKVQFINVQNVYEHIDTFGCNISKVWYHDANGLMLTQEFMDGVMYKTLDFEGCTREKYAEKIIAKYPEYVSTNLP